MCGKIKKVYSSYQHGLDWWLQSTCQHILPIDVPEESVCLDGLRIFGTASQSLGNLSLHETTQQISGTGSQIGRQLDLAAQNGFDRLFAVLSGEWWLCQKKNC